MSNQKEESNNKGSKREREERSDAKSSKNQKKAKRPKEFSRLDALSELLESKSVVAAIYFNKEILITNNDIGSSKQTIVNANIQFIAETLQHLMKIKKKSKDGESIELGTDDQVQHLEKLYLLKIQSKFQKSISYIKDDFLCDKDNINQSKTRKKVFTWLLKNNVSEFLEKDDDFYFSFSEIDTIGLGEKRIKMIKFNEINNIRNLFNQTWHDVRYLKKLYQYFSETEIERCKILMIGKKNEHAEMKILGYILSQIYLDEKQTLDINEKIKMINQYIGISKKCCIKCDNGIKIINEFLEKYFEINNKDKKQELKDFLGGYFFKTRGSNKLEFEWPEPSYLNGKKYFNNGKIHIVDGGNKETSKKISDNLVKMAGEQVNLADTEINKNIREELSKFTEERNKKKKTKEEENEDDKKMLDQVSSSSEGEAFTNSQQETFLNITTVNITKNTNNRQNSIKSGT